MYVCFFCMCVYVCVCVCACVGMVAVKPCFRSMCAWDVCLDGIQPVRWQQTEASCSVRWKKFPLVQTRSKSGSVCTLVCVVVCVSGWCGAVLRLRRNPAPPQV